MNKTTTYTTLKPFTVHLFNPNLIDRTEKSLERVMPYSNQPVIITKVHAYWDRPQYTVVPAWTPTECEFLVHSDELWYGKPMKLGRRNNYHLYTNDTDQFSDAELREVYAESFDDGEPSEDDLYRIACETVDEYLSDFLGEIERYENVHGKEQYIVLAKLGLWDGTYAGGQIILGMNEVISKCTQSLDGFNIYFKNGRLCIDGYHHDGHNSFVIRELKDGSADYIMNHEWYDEPEDLHRHLFNSSRWSMRVKIFDILGYGGGVY